MSVVSEWNKDHVTDNLLKHICLDCSKEFITGVDLSEGIKISCPYCKSENTEALSCTTDNQIINLELGCVGICYSKKGMRK